MLSTNTGTGTGTGTDNGVGVKPLRSTAIAREGSASGGGYMCGPWGDDCTRSAACAGEKTVCMGLQPVVVGVKGNQGGVI